MRSVAPTLAPQSGATRRQASWVSIAGHEILHYKNFITPILLIANPVPNEYKFKFYNLLKLDNIRKFTTKRNIERCQISIQIVLNKKRHPEDSKSSFSSRVVSLYFSGAGFTACGQWETHHIFRSRVPKGRMAEKLWGAKTRWGKGGGGRKTSKTF